MFCELIIDIVTKREEAIEKPYGEVVQNCTGVISLARLPQFRHVIDVPDERVAVIANPDNTININTIYGIDPGTFI